MIKLHYITSFVLVLPTSVILVAACGRPATTAPTPNPIASSTAVPATIAPTVPPTAVPTQSAPTVAPTELVPSPAPTPDSIMAAIEAVIQAKYPDSTASIQCVQGDFAFAVVLPPPGGLHGIGAYLRQQDGGWTVAAAGLGIFHEDLLSLGFPKDFCGMPPAHDQPQPTPAADDAAVEAALQAHYPEAFRQIQCVQGDFAAAMIAPNNGQHGIGAYLQQQNGAWTVVVDGIVSRGTLQKLGFPSDLCHLPPLLEA